MPERRKESGREDAEDRREEPLREETWSRTLRFVRTSHFNVLNEEMALLDKPGGLDILHNKYCGPKKPANKS